MPKFNCPHCRKTCTVPVDRSVTQVRCAYCGKAVSLVRPAAPAPNWFLARDKKKLGPYNWKQLLKLAEAGELSPFDMLLAEGATKWVRAGTLRLFASPTTAGVAPPTGVMPKPPQPRPIVSLPTAPAAKPAARTGSRGLIAGFVGAVAVIGLGAIAGFYYLASRPTIEPRPANHDKPLAKIDHPDTKSDTPKTGDPKPEQYKTAEKKDPRPSGTELAERVVDRLNRYRKAAGLGHVTLDADLSRGCLAHARYLAEHIDSQTATADDVRKEDPLKPGFTAEGDRAGESAMVAFAEPPTALDRWMGRLFSRVPLLSPDVRSIGVGCERNARGEWVCVLDPLRGRGEPIVVCPAPQEHDVPLAFAGGPEVTDAKAVGGFPITVTFPPGKKIANAGIELRDDNDKAIEGWSWTPEKPLSAAFQRNTIALIPKELLQKNRVYQVKASADVDGKPWRLAWSFTTEDDSDSKGEWAKKALAKVNVYRANAGLPPVALDDKLSRGCLAHARYLAVNADHPSLLGLKAHDEDASLPGYSDEGKQAGKASNLAIGDYEPLDGIDSWMATLYHRVGILEPNLKTIGFGCARGKRLGWITVLNVLAGRERSFRPHPVFYPAPDQTNVPVNFPISGEEPNPIPEASDGRAGYPITAFFPENEPLKNATGELTLAEGEKTQCWFSSPEKPANPKFAKQQGTAICLIPKKPLQPNTRYQVRIAGELADAKWEKKWEFTTGEAGVSVPGATKQVLAHVNAARARAGLAAVTVDDALSRSCQLHSEYLVANASGLAQQKQSASVNDEDPLLPGFTADGRQAARRSDVFTHAPVPVTQIDNLMATFTRRVSLLDPELQRIGFGCANDVGRGWRCVLDLNSGRGDPRVVLYPAPDQTDVPCAGDDPTDKAGAKTLGFPITVTFPRQANVRKAQAVLLDAAKNAIDAALSSPDTPIDEKQQRNTIALHPLSALKPGQTYTVTISAIVNAAEWRRTWQFTTRER